VALGYDRPLYIVAFDHRGSFEKQLFGLAGEPGPADVSRIADAKTVIYGGFLAALDGGVPKNAAGVLVDEQFGADVARAAKAADVVLAMPVEKSGQDEFDFDYGAAFGAHVERFDALHRRLAGALDRAAAARTIADACRRFVAVYAEAATAARP
jgi:myo-inositol catabolism protein IolC